MTMLMLVQYLPTLLVGGALKNWNFQVSVKVGSCLALGPKEWKLGDL